MKHAYIGVVLVFVAYVAITAIERMATHETHEVPAQLDARVQPLVEDAIGDGTCWKALCPTVDGGVAQNVMQNVDGGATFQATTDYTVINTSATAVRAGPSATTQGGFPRIDENHGVPIGNCAACVGMQEPFHARGGKCKSTAAQVVVDVCGGRP